MTNAKHNMFSCRCATCTRRYLAWCDSPAATIPDQRWGRYDNPSIKNDSARRGFVSNGDLMCCGYSLMEVWTAWKVARPAAA